jgi:NADH-quinone oxidoreductase subunit N
MIPAPTLELRAALPLILISLGAFAVLLAEILLKPRGVHAPTRNPAFASAVLCTLSVLTLAAIMLSSASMFAEGSSLTFNVVRPFVRLDRFAHFSIALVALGSLLSCLLSYYYLRELKIDHGEYYALILLATSGMILLVSAVDLIAVFLGIELLSIPIYVLAGFDRRKLRSNEAALKYFLVGSFASAILLYGMALLYGATGATDFVAIRQAFETWQSAPHGAPAPGAASLLGQPLAALGLAFVVVGFTFKISAVPFHQWTPDVYEGAPTSVTAFMSVTVKAAAFAGLMRILGIAFGGGGEALRDVLWWLAVGTMIVGNVMAVIQENVKRLLAYSSVAHAGYLLMGLVAGTQAGSSAMLFYLLAYSFTNLGAFAVIIALTNRGQDLDRIEDFAGLARSRPALAALMTLFMVSLAGMPGTAGFIGKLQVFLAAVREGYVGLTIIAVMTSLVSFYYYLRLPVVMYMREPGAELPRMRLHSAEGVVLAVCAIAVIALGLFPGEGPLFLSWVHAVDWTRESAAVLAGR